MAPGLIVRELTANAQKIWIAIERSRRLRVHWDVEAGDWFLVEWRETGASDGSKHGKAGFGTKLIKRELQSVLRASIEREFASEDLVATFRIPPRGEKLTVERRVAAR